MKKLNGLWVVVLTASCCGLAASAAKADDSMAMPPMPKAGAEMKAIAPVFATNGSWKGKVEAGAMGPDSKETTSAGHATGHALLGGLWDACDVTDTYGTGKTAMTWKGHMLVGYDVNSKSYKAVGVDNMGTLTQFDGTLDGSKFTLVTPNEIMMMGAMMKDRLTWDMTNPKAIKFTDEHQMSGGDWKLVESATMMPAAMKSAAKPMASAQSK